MSKPLEKEFKYYLDNQNEFVKKYNGKVIVIKNQKVIGVYDIESEAIKKTLMKEKLGSFLIQKCEPGRKAYKATFNSRVSFV